VTKRKLTPQQKLRNELDRRVTDLLPLVEQMIDDGVPVIVAFKLAMCWELEVMYYQLTTQVNQQN